MRDSALAPVGPTGSPAGEGEHLAPGLASVRWSRWRSTRPAPPTDGVDPSGSPTRVRLRIRPARISDLPPLVDLYLGLSSEARHRFHPFPFRRHVAVTCFGALLVAQHLLPPFSRRLPQTLLHVVVAQVGDGPELAGYGTIRAVRVPNLGPRVRFGFIVADEFQGHGIGPRIVRRLAETAVAHGFERDIGTVFRSDTVALRAMAKFGASFVETDSRESAAPDEPLFEVHGLLRDKLRLIGPEDPIVEGPGRVPAN